MHNKPLTYTIHLLFLFKIIKIFLNITLLKVVIIHPDLVGQVIHVIQDILLQYKL